MVEYKSEWSLDSLQTYRSHGKFIKKWHTTSCVVNPIAQILIARIFGFTGMTICNVHYWGVASGFMVFEVVEVAGGGGGGGLVNLCQSLSHAARPCIWWEEGKGQRKEGLGVFEALTFH